MGFDRFLKTALAAAAVFAGLLDSPAAGEGIPVNDYGPFFQSSLTNAAPNLDPVWYDLSASPNVDVRGLYQWTGFALRRITTGPTGQVTDQVGTDFERFNGAGLYRDRGIGSGKASLENTIDLYAFSHNQALTRIVVNPTPGLDGSAFPASLVNAGSRLFFTATTNVLNGSRDLFTLSGSSLPFTAVRLTTFGQDNPGTGTIGDIIPTEMDGIALFTVKRPGAGASTSLELWWANAFAEAAFPVARIDGHDFGDVSDNHWWGGNALRFNRPNERMSTSGTMYDGSQITMEFWMNPAYLPASGTTMTMIERSALAGIAYTISLTSDGLIQVAAQGDSSPGLQVNTSASRVSANQWNHVAVVFEPGGGRIHINGALDATFSLGGNVLPGAFGTMNIGGRSDASSGFVGMMDELRFWNGARPEADILANYQKTIQTAGSGVVANFTMDLQRYSTTDFPAPLIFSVGHPGLVLALSIPGGSTTPDIVPTMPLTYDPRTRRVYFAGISLGSRDVEAWAYDLNADEAGSLGDLNGDGPGGTFPTDFVLRPDDKVAFAVNPPGAGRQARVVEHDEALGGSFQTIFTNPIQQTTSPVGNGIRILDAEDEHLVMVADSFQTASPRRTVYWADQSESVRAIHPSHNSEPMEAILDKGTLWHVAKGVDNLYRVYRTDCNTVARFEGTTGDYGIGPRGLRIHEDKLFLLNDPAANQVTVRVGTGFIGVNGGNPPCWDALPFPPPVTASHLFGHSVTGVGDVNGDGFEDVLIADPEAVTGNGQTGAVFLALGRADGAVAAGDYIRLAGVAAGDQLGLATSGAGDFNGDGLSDFLVGAPRATRNGNANHGEAYLIFGSPTRFVPGATLNAADTSGGRGVLIRGFNSADAFTGISVAGVGNLNGDRNPSNNHALDDIIIGAPGLDGFRGNAFILYGNRNAPATITLSSLGGAGTRIRFQSATFDPKGYGGAVSGAGDVNGDGIPDFLVGSLGQNGQFPEAHYLIYGKADGYGTAFDAMTPPANVHTVRMSHPQWAPAQINKAMVSQAAAPAGDVDGDGLADIIIRRTSNDELSAPGRVYVVRGSFDPIGNNGLLDLDNLANDQNGDGNPDGHTFTSPDTVTDPRFGMSIAGGGDLNGDGFADVLVGSFFTSAIGFSGPTMLYTGQNALYVVYGDPAPLPTYALKLIHNPDMMLRIGAREEVTVRGGMTGGEAEFLNPNGSAAGDFDGDGMTDVLFGRTSGTFGTGAASLVRGQAMASSAVYTNYIRSGVAGVGGVQNLRLPTEGVGSSGNGRYGQPLSRVSFAFEGGGSSFDPALPSRQQVTIHRSAPPRPHPDWDPLPVHWNIQTDRESQSIAPVQSTIYFHLAAWELEGFDRNLVAFFHTADDPPTAISTWTPVQAQFNPERRTYSITRAHGAGEVSSSINGTYGLFQINETYELGQEIIKPAAVVAAINAGQLTIFDPEVIPAGTAFWHASTRRIYATAPSRHNLTDPSRPIQIVWRANNQSVIATQIVNTVWPTEDKMQLHVSGTPPIDMTDGGRFQTIRLMATDPGNPAAVNQQTLESQRKFVADGPGDSRTGEGRAFVMLAQDTDPRSSPIYFLPVRTVSWDNPNYGQDKPILVAQHVDEPTLHTDPSTGPFVFFERAYYNAEANYYNRTERTGPIIPVNVDIDPTTPVDNLVVAFYQRTGKLLKGFEQVIVTSQLSFPHTVNRYDVQWNPAAPEIVIASLAGSGALDSLGTLLTLYYQNNRSLPGFNPNDEHALILSNVAYALRNDLNVVNSSNLATNPNTGAPHVLVKFLNPDGQRRMHAFRVKATNAEYDFTYEGVAGTRIQAPVPLSIISPTEPCPNTAVGPDLPNGSYLVSGQGYVDRKGELWALAGSDAATPGNNPPAPLVYRYFYNALPGFYIPGASPAEPTPGTCLPWLDRHAGTPGTPVDITYNVRWPENPPELRFGETLLAAKNGLPDIVGRLSVEILYDQSQRNGGDRSVLLYNPLLELTTPLAAIPAGIATELQGPKIVFPDLAPALKARLFYDPFGANLVFRGFYVTEDTPEPYILPNVLTQRERNYLTQEFSTAPAWATALANLPAPAISGVISLHGSLPSFAKALTSTTLGDGYVVVIFENDSSVPPSTPITMSVFRVTCPLVRGSLHAINPDCVFDEKLTMRHTADIGGRTDSYEYQWVYQPDSDGTQPPPPVGEPGGGDDNWILVPSSQLTPQTGIGAVDFTIRGSGLLTLSDNWVAVRYRKSDTPLSCPTDWSVWTPPQLAEGWIKRVLGRIDPFKQRAVGGGIQTAEDRFFAFQNNQINTIVSMISQAGRRYAGDVALNCANLDAYGLIEIYQTVLNRGKGLSIDGLPPVDYAPANNALLLAASRIADLYLLLGNEAYADAQDPTIGIGGEDALFGSVASSIHCFMNQTSSLIGEELALLRGRDDRLAPGVQVTPVYNRLYWNFTRDITGGEVAYALNYNIKDQSGNVDGTINALDAAILYPQGHGDAWGHYLTAIKTYYDLLKEPQFTWVPRPEAVLVNGVPVSVDYFDERKFATIAAAKARTGAEVVSLTYRAAFTEDPAGQYKGYKDTDPQRAWGLSEWGSRTGEGAYFDWVVANAILPDTDPVGEGIQRIDRGTVAELGDIAAAMNGIQAQVDKADSGLNPLGLAKNVVLFDIDPSQVVAGYGEAQTHFERVYGKAAVALTNAQTAFEYANAATQALRNQADAIAEFQQTVSDTEIDYTSRLIEIFGYPYPNDIGPSGAYPTGYDGPDYLHWMYSDPVDPAAASALNQTSVSITRHDFTWNNSGDFVLDSTGNPKKENRTITFTFDKNTKSLVRPAAWIAPRRAPGELQLANSDLLQAQLELRKAVSEYSLLIAEIEEKTDELKRRIALFDSKVALTGGMIAGKVALDVAIIALKTFELGARTAAENAKDAAKAAGTAVPSSTIGGLAVGGDFLSAIRAALNAIGNIAAGALGAAGDIAEVAGLVATNAQERLEEGLNLRILVLEQQFEVENEIAALELLFRSEPAKRLEIYQQHEAVRQAASRVAQQLAAGERMLEDRARFRRQTAAAVQEYRYKDMAFRIFRNEALQKYRAQFDLAAQYAYLAASAFDYETNLLPGDPAQPGSVHMTRIVRSRSLGVIRDGEPQVGGTSGDPGIASAMARMRTNWDLNLRNRLGFNNPDVEGNLFSLRTELFRIPDDPEFDEEWREVLLQAAEAGLNFQSDPDVRRYALPIPGANPIEPGLVLKFSTTINFGQNLFGYELSSGDSAFDPTATTTKIRRHSVILTGYNDVGLSATPRVYLFPAGVDTLRSPTSGLGKTREWRIVEQLIPVPFPLTETDLIAEEFIPRIDNLTGEFGRIRRFGLVRAIDEDDFEPSDPSSANGLGYTTDLVGRSVWNSNWVLVIPAGTMLGDRQEAIRRFIYGEDGEGGISDIKIFFESYAFQGAGRRGEVRDIPPPEEEDWPPPAIDFIEPADSTRIRTEVR